MRRQAVGAARSFTAWSFPVRGCSSRRSTCTAARPPFRRFLPELIDLVRGRRINPGRVFDFQTTARRDCDRLGQAGGHQSVEMVGPVGHRAPQSNRNAGAVQARSLLGFG
jgi:hypothetical protein